MDFPIRCNKRMNDCIQHSINDYKMRINWRQYIAQQTQKMSSFAILLSFAVFAAVYVLYRRYSRFSLSGLPGPDSDSFLFGNFIEYLRSEAGEADFKWQEKYGDVVRLHAPFGGERLLISDPKALHYAWQMAGTSFDKPPARTCLSEMALGPGLINVIGDVHTRQRRVMIPGFGSTEAKSAVPVFSKHAGKLSAKWTDMISNESSEQAEVDVHYWLSRAALDAIGEVAFDYQLGALDHTDNKLTKGYFSLVFDLFNIQKNKDILLINLLDTLPRNVTRFLLSNLPNPRLERGRQTGATSTSIAKQLVDEKYAALEEGKPSKDIMSLLVKANVNAHTSSGGKGLSDVELLAQMNTILIAGHETTANSLTFALLEFARNKSIQDKLRAEIREAKQRMTAQGRSEFTSVDFDTMHYLGAVVKETLRVHPVVYNQFRQAEKDEVLPLHRPIVTKTGQTLTELPVKKGTILIASIAGYNRHKDVFGQDAHTFNPDRWLKKDTIYNDGALPGVYANVFTFGGGTRSCIGWRFALMELQAFLAELVGNFEFSLAPDVDPTKIRREACFAMTPTMKGEEEKGSQLKMTVKLVSEDED